MQETSATDCPGPELISTQYLFRTRIHCPRCGINMVTNNWSFLTELNLVCRGCGLLAKWTGSQEIDFLTWNAGEVEP